MHATDDILIFEDDVYWQFGSGMRLVYQIKQHPEDIISAYTSYSNGAQYEGWHEFDSPIGMCGSLATYVPYKHREGLIRFVLSRTRTFSLDVQIGDYAMATGTTLWHHTPTLVLHLGARSTSVPADNSAIPSPNRAPCLAPLAWRGPCWVQSQKY